MTIFFVHDFIDIKRYCEWIEVTDDDNGQTYCYPIQRWLDKYINLNIRSDS
jgi:hypothetical protein